MWRLGVRFLRAGGVGLVGAVALGVGCLVACTVSRCHGSEISTVILVSLTGALLCGVQASTHRALLEAVPWLSLLLGSAAAAVVEGGSAAAWSCVVSGAALVHFAACSWWLTRGGAAMLAGATQP